MKNNRSTGTTHIGIQVASEAVHAVQFASNGTGYRLKASACVPWPEAGTQVPEQIAAAFRTITREVAWSSRQAVLALPAEEVDIRPVRLPADVAVDDSPRFRAALMAEARVALLYDPREAIVDFLPLPSGPAEHEDRAQVLLVAARKSRVGTYLDAMSQAGLRCLCVDIAPCAAVRAMVPHPENTLLVDLHDDYAQVSVYAQGHILFSRVVKHGLAGIVQRLTAETALSVTACTGMLRQLGVNHRALRSIDAAAMETGSLSPETMAAMIYETAHVEWNQLVNEFQRTADYFALQTFGGPIAQICLIGETVPPGLDALIESRMKVPVSIGDMRPAFREVTEAAGPGALVAAGLAMREVKHARRN